MNLARIRDFLRLAEENLIKFLQNNDPSSVFVVHHTISEQVSDRVDI